MPATEEGRCGTSRRDTGAAAVELALVLPLLLLILFGIIDLGRALNTQITLTQGGREGARAAALQDPDVQARVDLATQAISPVGTNVVAACSATSAPGDQAVVEATKTFDFITPVGALVSMIGGGGIGSSIAMTGRGVMRCG